MLTKYTKIDYNIIVKRYGKEACLMEEYEREESEMNVGEMLVQVTEENQTRKILEILNGCETLEEAKEKVRALLNK